MTLNSEQRKEVVRVCGENFTERDIPALWLDEVEEKAEAEDRRAEEVGGEK